MGYDSGLTQGSTAAMRPPGPQHAGRLGEEVARPREVVHEVEAHHGVEGAGGERQPAAVGGDVVPRRADDVGRDPAEVGPAPARVRAPGIRGPRRSRARAAAVPRLREQRVEPGLVDRGPAPACRARSRGALRGAPGSTRPPPHGRAMPAPAAASRSAASDTARPERGHRPAVGTPARRRGARRERRRRGMQ